MNRLLLLFYYYYPLVLFCFVLFWGYFSLFKLIIQFWLEGFDNDETKQRKWAAPVSWMNGSVRWRRFRFEFGLIFGWLWLKLADQPWIWEMGRTWRNWLQWNVVLYNGTRSVMRVNGDVDGRGGTCVPCGGWAHVAGRKTREGGHVFTPPRSADYRLLRL